MTQPEERNYFIDQERMEEMYRLNRQDRIVTAAAGGLLPEAGGTFEGIHDVLDVACGSGGWALDVGEGFSGVRVVGIDKSERMIAFAQRQAAHLPNVQFSRMDATKRLEFPDNSFDLINARMIHGFMPKGIWSLFLRECCRLLRPMGMVRLTQDDSPATNSAAFEQVVDWGLQAMYLAGQSFSPRGSRRGIPHALYHLLRDAGFLGIQHRAFAVNFSNGTADHETVVRNFEVAFDLGRDFLIEQKVTNEADFALNYTRMVDEMKLDEFTALWFFLTIWGYKPAHSS